MAIYALRIEAVIPEDRRLVVNLPPDTPVGAAEIIILSTADQIQSNGPAILRSLDEHSQPYEVRSAEEIDRQIEEERAAWD